MKLHNINKNQSKKSYKRDIINHALQGEKKLKNNMKLQRLFFTKLEFFKLNLPLAHNQQEIIKQICVNNGFSKRAARDFIFFYTNQIQYLQNIVSKKYVNFYDLSGKVVESISNEQREKAKVALFNAIKNQEKRAEEKKLDKEILYKFRVTKKLLAKEKEKMKEKMKQKELEKIKDA